MSDVRRAASAYLAKAKVLDVLINYAADFDLSGKKPVITDEGMEKQFATNVAAPYLLSNLVLDALNNSVDGRIINISTLGLDVFPRSNWIWIIWTEATTTARQPHTIKTSSLF